MWAELHRPSGKDVAVLGAPHGVGFVEPDAAGLTERATEIVRRTEHRGRAEAVLTFTLQGCKALDRPERVAAVGLTIES